MPILKKYCDRVAAGDLVADPAQEAAAERLSVLARELGMPRSGVLSRLFGSKTASVTGVYLHGGVGRGKSMLMDLFFDEVAIASKRRVHFHEFMLEIHDAVAQARDAGERDPIAVVARSVADDAALLCFDELHVTDIADAMILGRLFEALFARGVTMVATSNRPPEDLYKDGINRQLFLPFIDMLRANMDVHALDAARDYRLERLKGAEVWLHPLNPDAQAALDDLWRRIVCGDDERVVRLSVQGRVLVAERAAAGAARFTFEALCGRPLGAADYLALTRRFHTLVIENIPKLGAHNRNEAKRFVTLIDTLYEARVKLIASADAPPEALYPQGDGAFEFARTVSRLHEMGSVAYLAAARRAA